MTLSSPPPDSEGTTPRKTIHLDGRTLEGGGQLVRNAVALAALTGQPIHIDHVRANRPGKKGLKGTHVAAIHFLADVSGSTYTGVEVGSSSLTFVPPARPSVNATTTTTTPPPPDINIVLPTAGSVFLVFQALYPYILHTATTPVRLCITGGTNVSFAPSFDYVAQVLAPNLERLGLPRLTVQLDRRGWATGPFSLGKVTMLVEPLPSRVHGREQSQEGRERLCFPPLDLGAYHRSGITQIDITVLAPDDLISVKATRRLMAKDGRKAGSDGRRQPFSSPSRERASDSTTASHSPVTIRQAVEQEVLSGLHRGLRRLPAWVFDSSTTSNLSEDEAGDLADSVPIRIHTSEATRHPAHLYIMIVAHTTNGLKISHEALSGSRPKAKKGHHDATEQPAAARELAEQCVAGFLQELYDPRLQGSSRPGMAGAHRPCVDVHLRDQTVIFEALGGVFRAGSGNEQAAQGTEDQRFWSLHTRTAQWVCDEILGPFQ